MQAWKYIWSKRSDCQWWHRTVEAERDVLPWHLLDSRWSRGRWALRKTTAEGQSRRSPCASRPTQQHTQLWDQGPPWCRALQGPPYQRVKHGAGQQKHLLHITLHEIQSSEHQVIVDQTDSQWEAELNVHVLECARRAVYNLCEQAESGKKIRWIANQSLEGLH